MNKTILFNACYEIYNNLCDFIYRCTIHPWRVACSGGGSPYIGASTSSRSGFIGGHHAVSGPSGSVSVSVGGRYLSSSHNFDGLGNCADRVCSGNK
jgi:hypothetical protein